MHFWHMYTISRRTATSTSIQSLIQESTVTAPQPPLHRQEEDSEERACDKDGIKPVEEEVELDVATEHFRDDQPEMSMQ